MLDWMLRSMGDSATMMSGVVGALEEAFNPAAAKARKELEAYKEHRVEAPSPGDRILDDGRITITLPAKPAN